MVTETCFVVRKKSTAHTSKEKLFTHEVDMRLSDAASDGQKKKWKKKKWQYFDFCESNIEKKSF